MSIKRIAVILVTIVILVGCFSSCSSNSLDFIRIPAPSLQENLIGEEDMQEIAVILPNGYSEASDPYPVLFFLPGFSSDYKQTARNLASVLQSQPEEEQKIVVVVINGTSKLDGCFYTNSPITGNWADYVVNDVGDYVDRHYNVKVESRFRGIAGHSMGGFGAINLAMRYPDRFGTLYAMSPGLFDENGLERSGIDFSRMEEEIVRLRGLSSEDALSLYRRDFENMRWPDNFAFAYASAFAYDIEEGVPYIRLPEKSLDGEYQNDEAYDLYVDGFGGWEQKIQKYRESFMGLEGFVIDYGEQDELRWIPEGSRALSAILTDERIPHQLLPYEGTHTSRIAERFKNSLLPFFIDVVSK